MNGSSDSVRLSRLRTELNRTLSAFMRRTSTLTPRVGSRPQPWRAGVGEDPPATDHAARRRRAGLVTGAGGDPNGGAIFLDDERGVRALAKEIKRLIAEDIRRGIGFGG